MAKKRTGYPMIRNVQVRFMLHYAKVTLTVEFRNGLKSEQVYLCSHSDAERIFFL